MQELAGTFEISEANENKQDELLDLPSTSAAAMQQLKRAKLSNLPKWTKRCDKSKNFPFVLSPKSEELVTIQSNLFEEIHNLSPIQLFEKFFDKEVMDLIVNESNTYAQQQNHEIDFDESYVRRFIGILILSGYNTLPSIDDYWSTNPCLGNPIIKQSMSRKTFKDMKRFIHFNNNNNLDKNDKLTKVK